MRLLPTVDNGSTRAKLRPGSPMPAEERASVRVTLRIADVPTLVGIASHRAADLCREATKLARKALLAPAWHGGRHDDETRS